MPDSSKLSVQTHRRPGMGRLLAGISIGAASLALASAPAPVLAQAVNGTPTPQFGIGNISRSTPGLDAVFVNGSEGLIDWTATDSGGVFLPEGNTLRFIYDGSTPYTVLNRITDTAVGGPLSISGTVESSSQGQIWFYNAGGWVVGPKGVFNVGSLVLTSLPVAVDPASDTVSRLYGDNSEIRFGAALDPQSSVSIQSGASISATLANGSYLALVAPRVDQAGTVRVNGSAAYVAASAATMTINSGLFDIVVDSGSEDATGVSHTGSTTWATDVGTTDPHHGVYLVAVPKNQAMTAVVSGRLGYDSATTASVVDGLIVLSAGHDVSGGNIVSDSVAGADASLAISNLTIGSTGATNNLIGSATGNIAIEATTGDTLVHGSADLKAFGDISTVIDGKSFTVEGDLLLASANGAKSGDVSVAVSNGGSLSVNGTLDLSSIAIGEIQTDPMNGDTLLAGSVGEDANSGAVSLTVEDGNVSAAVTNVISRAISGVGQLAVGDATSGGSTVSVSQTDGAASTFGVSFGAISISSSASNGYFSLQSANTGGSATSGAVSLAIDGGAYTSTGVSVSSQAYTVSGTVSKALDAGAGAVSISFANSNVTHETGSIVGNNYASASDGGIAALGDVTLSYDKVTSSTSDSFGNIFLESYAYGDLLAPNTVALNLTGGSQLDTFGSSVNLDASGWSATGTQRSGNVSFLSDASALFAGYLDLASRASAPFGSVSDAFSGDVSAVVRAGSNVTLEFQARLNSSARGGSGTSGGSGTAGDVSFSLADASFSGDLYLTSNGIAGSRTDSTGSSGIGTGGAVSFSQSGTAARLTADTVAFLSLGQGGSPNEGSRLFLQSQAGDGATGQGGTTSFSLTDGIFGAAALSVASSGEGGDGANEAGIAPGKGGSGLGGTATLAVSGGILSAPDIKVQASGYGGDGAQADNFLGIGGGRGGDGTGGTAFTSLTGGTVRAESLLIEANGNKSYTDPNFGYTSYFGNGGYETAGVLKPGTGGLGSGGTALLTIDGGSLQPVEPYADVPPAVQVNAIGEGGPGGFAYSSGNGDAMHSGSGGDGLGGSATIRYLSGTFDAAAIGVDASGLGGLPGNLVAQAEPAVNAGNGGSGTGGTALFEIASSLDKLTTLGDLRSVRVIADGLATVGEDGGIGGSGGNGHGGVARLLATGGTVTIADLILSAQGTGGRGGDAQVFGNGGRGGSGTGGVAQVVADGSGAQLSLQGPALQVAGQGGAGGRGGLGADGNDVAGDGGDGGTGTGGEVAFLATNLGKLDVTGFSTGSSFDASGQGGSGGLGGNAAETGGIALGDGGNGASGVGGTISATASRGGNLSFDSLTLTASGIGGVGGGRLEGNNGGIPNPSVGGLGGSGQGGSIRIVSTGTDSIVTATSLQASADGRGATGADGAGYTPAGQSTDGSAGGDGTGGSFSLLADLEGTIQLAAGSGDVSITASGFGGNGGRAQDAIGTSGASGGNGGDSGIGSGGTIQFNASRQGAASIGMLGSTSVVASGTGGVAGLGGNGAPATAPGANGGNGGNAGLAWAGVGGDIAFGADGGTLDFGSLDVRAAGTTRVGSFVGAGGSGPGGSGLPGTRSYVLPIGGTVAFAASDDAGGGFGQINSGVTTAEVTSTAVFLGQGAAAAGGAGGISLSNSSTALDGGLHFASFLGDALGAQAIVDPAIDISVTAGKIVVDTDLSLFARGNIAVRVSDNASFTASTADLQSETGITIAGSGTGRFSSGTINLLSFGSIGIASNDCITATCRPVEASADLVSYAIGDFSLSGPAELAGLGGVTVYAAGDITGDAGTRYFSAGNVAVRAGGDATIRNITGANVIAEAGAIEDGSFIYYDGLLTLGEAESGGVFNASGSLDLNSGGTVQTNGGTNFAAGSGIGVRSGNDILIGSENAFAANTSLPSQPDRVVFAAGGQSIAYQLPSTDIATLSVGLGTTVNAGAGGIDISGAAIDTRLASFTGAFFRADLIGSLTLGSVRRSEDGRLDPDCLEGAICIGNVDSADFVSIGTGDFVPLDIHAAGAIFGETVLLRATSDITLGGSEIFSHISAVDDLTINSLSGGIALLGNSALAGGTVRLTAASNLSGSGIVEATRDDIGLSIGGDIDTGSLIAAGELTTAVDAGGEAEGSFTASGALRTGVLSLGGPANVSATGEIGIDSLSLAGSDGTFTAGTALQLGSSSAVGALSLIAGTEVTFGEIVTGGNLAIEGQSVNGTSANAGGTLSITSTNLGADLLQSAGDLTLTITDTAALGTVTSTGGSVDIDPALLTFDAISASNGITLAGGTIGGGRIDAGTTLSISAQGDLLFSDAKAGDAISITAATLDGLTITGEAGLSLTATGAINLGTVKVLGSFDLSGGSLVLGTSNSGLDTTFSITGDATIGSITAGLASTGQNLVQIVVQALANSYTGGSLVPVFDVEQGQTITVSSSTDDLWSAGALPRFSDGNGLVAFRLATSQDDSGIQPGTQIGAAFGNLSIGNFNAPFGALVGQIGNQNVLIGANGTVTIPATGTLSVGYWDSNAGDNTGSIAFTFGSSGGGASVSNPANANISAGGKITIGSATATSAVGLDAGGALKIDSADAGTVLSLSGNTINAGTLNAGTDITLTSTGASVIGTATAGGRFSAAVGGLDFTLIDAAGAIDIASLAGVDGGDLRSGARIVVDASGSIVIRDATASTDMALTTSAAGDIAARTLAAGADIVVEGRDFTLTSATAGADFRASVRSLASPEISAGGAFSLSGTGEVEVGTVSAGSALSVTSLTLTFNRMVSTGTLDIGTTGNVAGGDLLATGTLRINSGLGQFAYGTLDGGDVAVLGGSIAGGAVRARAGNFNLGVAGDATIGAISATGNVGIDAQRLGFSSIAAGGTFGTTNASMTGTSIVAGQDVDISSQGDIALASLSGASARINSSGIVNIAGLRLSGTVSVSANAVGLDALGDLAVGRISAFGGNVDVAAEGSITGGTIEALGDIDLLARSGNVVIGQISAGYADVFGGSLRPQARVTSGAVGQGSIDIVASGDIVINDVADAAKALTMNAGDTIRITGLATGATIDLTSADLVISATGTLGETAHTDSIALRNTGQGPLLLGDNIDSAGGGYAVSQAEFSRIRSRGDLAIQAAQALLVGDLAVTAQSGTAQGQVGENGEVSLRSGGLASFFGALSMSNASGNTLSVNSQSGVVLDSSSGSIRLLEGEARAGTLAISGSGIAMVTGTALGDISQLTDTALITDRLGLNDGVADGRTLVEADVIQLRSDREVYIQNTSLGTQIDDRRGLVANSLRIGSRDGGQLDIVINGIVNGQAGVDTIEQIGFDEDFSDPSSVNGCAILNANACNKVPFENFELRDLVEEVLETNPAENALQVVDSFTETSVIQLSPIAPAGFEPLIDEPVTGTGNDDILGEGKQGGE